MKICWHDHCRGKAGTTGARRDYMTLSVTIAIVPECSKMLLFSFFSPWTGVSLPFEDQSRHERKRIREDRNSGASLACQDGILRICDRGDAVRQASSKLLASAYSQTPGRFQQSRTGGTSSLSILPTVWCNFFLTKYRGIQIDGSRLTRPPIAILPWALTPLG